MKITNISCTQFAGVRDRSISLTDGINVIYGKNESGKSTLVNLIARTLFQDARLDKRSDKDFIDTFFPAAKKGASYAMDFADGRVSFETENGTFTLTKEWGTDPRAILSTPDGMVRDSAAITAILKDALIYGEGVYTDMLLSSQRNTDLALQTILDASKKTDAKQEIADAVSLAFAESDGISTDTIEQAIYGKIEQIQGRHWDIERDAPDRKAGRWSNGLGEILKAYYALEDAKGVLEELSRLELDADRAGADYSAADAAFQTAEAAYNQFHAFAGMLTVQNERKKTISHMEAELKKRTAVLSEWPALSEKLKRAKELHGERVSRSVIDLYTAAKELHEEWTALKEKAADMCCPGEDEIPGVIKAQRTIASLENRLCGMNLSAAIEMFGGHPLEIKSLRTGESIDISAAKNITEAVRITVAGVMEMRLTPADVDAADIERQLFEQRTYLQRIFKKYGVSSLEELEALERTYSNIQNELSRKNTKLESMLGDHTFETVKAMASEITQAPGSAEEISVQITALCGPVELSSYIISGETTIGAYENEYESVAALKAAAFDLQQELDKAKASLAAAEDIPAEFAAISDPERHLELLKSRLDAKREQRETALRKKTAAGTCLEKYQENLSADPEANVKKAERALEEQKVLLTHWKHIAEVFAAQKGNIANHPLSDLAENFSRYLGIISGGKVGSEFPEADKLNMNIYSSDRLVSYGKLSEGTKETVSLAFRLAVLDHLFPTGGGVAVFDDPFANMDADRTARACELIKEFAARHQVIFLTCKETYLDVLAGNRILF